MARRKKKYKFYLTAYTNVAYTSPVMNKTTTNKPTTARLSADVLKEIEAMASKLKVSRSHIIRASVEKGFPFVKAAFAKATGKGAA
jgi:hypothetical protein